MQLPAELANLEALKVVPRARHICRAGYRQTDWPWRPLIGRSGYPDAAASQELCVVRMPCLAAPGVLSPPGGRDQHRSAPDSRQIWCTQPSLLAQISPFLAPHEAWRRVAVSMLHFDRLFEARHPAALQALTSADGAGQPNGVRRACPQVSPDPLDGWAFALADQLVGGGMDVRFSDAAGHAKSPVLAPCSADNVLTISDDYRK